MLVINKNCSREGQLQGYSESNGELWSLKKQYLILKEHTAV
jgi:hypothetical protein